MPIADRKQYEIEQANQDDNRRSSVQEYLDNSEFELEDVEGEEEVILKRTYGDETFVPNPPVVITTF